MGKRLQVDFKNNVNVFLSIFSIFVTKKYQKSQFYIDAGNAWAQYDNPIVYKVCTAQGQLSMLYLAGSR